MEATLELDPEQLASDKKLLAQEADRLRDHDQVIPPTACASLTSFTKATHIHNQTQTTSSQQSSCLRMPQTCCVLTVVNMLGC